MREPIEQEAIQTPDEKAPPKQNPLCESEAEESRLGALHQEDRYFLLNLTRVLVSLGGYDEPESARFWSNVVRYIGRKISLHNRTRKAPLLAEDLLPGELLSEIRDWIQLSLRRVELEKKLRQLGLKAPKKRYQIS